MEAVTLTNISKRYGSVEALRGVSLSVAPGELFGIIGPDGAGKTSLFRILTTLLLADGGSASVCGLDVVKDYKAIRRRVGYMPGRFSLYPDLTVEENLNFFATVFHTTIEENYDLVRDIYRQIEPFRKRRAGALSGGMKQKLALSCALIHKPDVLFLDEPTTGVDPVSRKEFWGMLRRLKERGITIIASTPIIDEARQCDRIAFINEGEIKGIDTPDRILTRFAGILCPPGLQHERVENHENKVIEVEGLTKRFGNFTAVDHISFQVHRGEIFGFLGANGAGKTTAMRMLTGLSRPTGGKACVAGFDVASQPEEVKKNIGYMSQKFSLYEDLKVWENIRLFAGIYGIPEAEIAPKTDELLLRLGLEKERDTLVKSLPLGWKQKLAFSVSIFHRPKIVFLDEPTGGVDPATRRQFWELIYQAADEGITVYIANGKRENVLTDLLLDGADVPCTEFVAESRGVSSVKKWIAHSDGFAKGEIRINQGAYDALMSSQASSLLPVGVVAVDGDFEKDDIVRVLAPDGRQFAVGRTSYDSDEARAAIGKQGLRPVIHYNYLYIEQL